MKHDHQHLDYLISQYVDGCLDPASRKSLEQQLVHNPAARELYKGHREVQDMLDDWGNRIPMIDWDEFEKKLSHRIEHEAVGSDRRQMILRRLRPLAVAAGLLLAVGVGYGWRAWSTTPASVPTASVAESVPVPHGAQVSFPEQSVQAVASQSTVIITEAPGASGAPNVSHGVTVSAPPDTGVSAPKAGTRLGLGPTGVQQSARPNKMAGSASAVVTPPLKPEKDGKEAGPAFP